MAGSQYFASAYRLSPIAYRLSPRPIAHMRIAALYDIHGNLPALDAVLADVQAADAELIVIGGDVVPGPLPRETLDRLLRLDTPTRFIRGNGDRVVREVMLGKEATEVPERFRDTIRWC